MTTHRSPTSPRVGLRLAATALLGAAALVSATPQALASESPATPAAQASPASVTFTAAQRRGQYVVPAGVHAIVVDMAGSNGGTGVLCTVVGGYGGRTTATIPVTPGEVLEGNVASSSAGATSSGNSSDLRRSPFTTADRIMVAGGGGWNSDHAAIDFTTGSCTGQRTGPGIGGDGGAPAGRTGHGLPDGCPFPGGHGGGGATQNAGGAGGTVCSFGGSGTPGGFGFFGSPGGSGNAHAPCDVGGYGGAGWYGGGGGATTSGSDLGPGGCTNDLGNVISPPPLGGGGGGGSSYVEPAGSGALYTVGANPNVSGWFSITVAARPRVTGVSPRFGPLGGGQTITITGTDLTDVTAVTVGGVAATHVVRVTATTITARTPAHAAGRVDVRVKSPAGTSPAVSADRYTYLKAPVVTSVSPRSGATGGGQTVTIVGVRLATASRVFFGTVKAPRLTVVSDTKLVVRSPNHGAGVVDVRVRTLGGLSAKRTADRFTFR